MIARYVFVLVCCMGSLQTVQLVAQGCSDAGACTMHGLGPEAGADRAGLKTTISIGGFVGTADYDIGVAGGHVAVSRQFTDALVVDLKLTSLAQSGNDISVFGLSDVFVNATYDLDSSIAFTVGAKIPLTDGGASLNALPLPMDYQSSLGTMDLIVGVKYSIQRLQIVGAYQQPLTQNSNTFQASLYPSTSVLSTIQSTNDFFRQPDVLLRVSYPLAIGDAWVITPSVLPIYHLANDRYTDEQGVVRDIEGSQGLTLNGNVYVDVAVSAQHALQFNIGMPFIVREARPDGLTRGFIATVQYSFRIHD